MSFRARNQQQRYQTRRLRPVAFRYDPVRDIACQQVEVPYGEVYAGEMGSDERSHEMLLTGGDASCFIDSFQTFCERAENRAAREWATRERKAA